MNVLLLDILNAIGLGVCAGLVVFLLMADPSFSRRAGIGAASIFLAILTMMMVRDHVPTYKMSITGIVSLFAKQVYDFGALRMKNPLRLIRDILNNLLKDGNDSPSGSDQRD